MNEKRAPWDSVLLGVLLVLISAILCVLVQYEPKMFASSMALNFLALAAAARAISKPAERSFLYKGAAFVLSLSGILIFSSAPFKAHGSTLSLFGCWAFAWLCLIFALNLILPRFGIGFRPPGQSKMLERPASGPPEVAQQWTDSVFTATVFLPMIGLLIFCGIGLGVALFVPHTPVDVNFKVDTAALVLVSLLLTLGNLMAWFLFLNQELRAFLVRSDLPIIFRRPATAIAAAGVFAWGVYIQVHYATGRLLAWGICGSLASILLTLFWRFGQAHQTPEESQPPALPKRYSLFVSLQIAILLLSGWIYSTLVLLAK